MISASNITVSFGGFTLYDGISFLIGDRDRIGLAGRNGAGKSTLLKILAGQKLPSSGDIARPNGCTLGYLAQDMVHNLGKTVFDEASTAFAELKELESKVEQLTGELSSRTDYETDAYMDIIHQLTTTNERLQVLDGFSMEGKIEVTLMGLGFERKDFIRLMDEFSGGWRMRVELAKLLLMQPNVLLLDEPTNHLDIESIQWLEEYLKTYDGAVVIVSHDKAFLDNLTTRTLELSVGKLFDYRANYTKYLQLRNERREQQASAAKNQQKEIERTEQLIDKFRAKASKATFAQSLIKKLDRMDIIEVDEEDAGAIRFKFPPAPRSGKVAVEAIAASKSYDEKVIFKNVDFNIEREERIAFVGKNGEGKSTMIKLITKVEYATSGTVSQGFSIDTGYFAQDDADTMDGNKTVFETIDDLAVGDMRKQVRGLLGSFLFSGDTVDKKVKVLSGGERTRLALCRLLLHPYNLLILDEPTNHLDMRSKDVLKSALMKYDGTLIIVSHDRDFLQGLTTKSYEFRAGNVKQHIGDINEFLKYRKIATISELNKKTTLAQATGTVVVKVAGISNTENEALRRKQKEESILKNKIYKLEEEISKLELEIKNIDEQLVDPVKYQVMMNDSQIFKNYEAKKNMLNDKMKDWENLSSSL